MTDNKELITKLRRYACSPMVSFCTAQMFEEAATKLEKAQAEIESLTQRYTLAVAEREANVKGFTEELEKEKAEIERLKKGINIELENYATEYDNKIKAEAVKEYINKAKEEMLNFAKIEINEHYYYLVGISFFDNILEETVGDADDK